VTAFELYAVFGIPALFLAIGGLGYLLTKWSAARDEHSHHAR
jgi:hypothetical protein